MRDRVDANNENVNSTENDNRIFDLVLNMNSTSKQRGGPIRPHIPQPASASSAVTLSMPSGIFLDQQVQRADYGDEQLMCAEMEECDDDDSNMF